MAFEPPDNPEPAPLGTTGIRYWCAAFMIALTCSVERGNTTAIGSPACEPVDLSRV